MELILKMIEDKLEMVRICKDPRTRIQYLNEIEWMSSYLPVDDDGEDEYTYLGETYEG